MNRRAFTTYGIGAAGVLALPSLAPAQPVARPTIPYSFVEVANNLGETVLSLTRNTGEAPAFEGFLDGIYGSIAAYLASNPGGANEAIGKSVRLLPDLAPRIERISKATKIPDVPKYFTEMSLGLQSDLRGWKGKGFGLVSFRIPQDTANCITSTISSQRACLGTMEHEALACGIISLPSAKAGVWGYLAAFTACMVTRGRDSDKLRACLMALQSEIAKCFSSAQ